MKPYLTLIDLKLEIIIQKEGLVEGWWKKGSSWQRNMLVYLQGCKSFEGGVKWYALPFNWSHVGRPHVKTNLVEHQVGVGG
jgi:hypothetical protein